MSVAATAGTTAWSAVAPVVEAVAAVADTVIDVFSASFSTPTRSASFSLTATDTDPADAASGTVATKGLVIPPAHSIQAHDTTTGQTIAVAQDAEDGAVLVRSSTDDSSTDAESSTADNAIPIEILALSAPGDSMSTGPGANANPWWSDPWWALQADPAWQEQIEQWRDTIRRIQIYGTRPEPDSTDDTAGKHADSQSDSAPTNVIQYSATPWEMARAFCRTLFSGATIDSADGAAAAVIDNATGIVDWHVQWVVPSFEIPKYRDHWTPRFGNADAAASGRQVGEVTATAQNAAMVLDGARSLAKGLDKLSKPDFWRALAAGERAGAGWLVTPSGALVYSPAGSQVLVGAAQPLGQLGAGAGSLSAGMAGWNDNPYNAFLTSPDKYGHSDGLSRSIEGTRGLQHSFDRHAAEWFARHGGPQSLKRWKQVIESAARSQKVVEWTTGRHRTIGHLARVDGNKWFFVQFYKEGPRAGELATAFIPNKNQIRAILELLGK